MKILKLVHTYENMGGLQIHMKALHRNIINRELAEVHVLYYSQDNNAMSFTDNTGINCHPVYNPQRGSKASKKVLKKFGDKFDEITRENDFDLMHVHYGYYEGAYLVMEKALEQKLPIIFAFHGGGLNLNPESVKDRSPLEKILPKVDLKMGICESAAKTLGLDSINIGTYVDADFFNPKKSNPEKFRQRLSIFDENVFLYPARIEPRKGQLDLVQASKILQESGMDFTTAIVGPFQDPEYVSQVQREISVQGLEGKVRIFRAMDHENLRNGYGCSTVVLSSHTEGVPRIMIEGLAMERGVVATEVGGVPEYIKSGETGLIVIPKNPESIAAGMTELVVNPKKAKEFGKAGRELVTARCELNSLVDRYFEQYEKVIN